MFSTMRLLGPAGLSLSPVEWKALRLAFRAGRLPAPLALLFASRDIRLLARTRAVGGRGRTQPRTRPTSSTRVAGCCGAG